MTLPTAIQLLNPHLLKLLKKARHLLSNQIQLLNSHILKQKKTLLLQLTSPNPRNLQLLKGYTLKKCKRHLCTTSNVPGLTGNFRLYHRRIPPGLSPKCTIACLLLVTQRVMVIQGILSFHLVRGKFYSHALLISHSKLPSSTPLQTIYLFFCENSLIGSG